MPEQQTAHQIISQLIAQAQLPSGFAEIAREYFVPLSDYIAQCYFRECDFRECDFGESRAGMSRNGRRQTLVVGVNGAQGTGKSTLSVLLKQLLQARGLECVTFSIDDLYLTRAQRAHLASEVHPLLQTRGVPGTHDVALGLALVEALKAATADSVITIPHFDKARDDRSPAQDWPAHSGPVDVLIIEGWCVGAQPASLTGTPINALEREQDADGVWRAYVEVKLLEYQRLFEQIDVLVMLKAPSMDSIIEWRTLQEQKLIARVGSASQQGIMNEDELLWFIMHYERLTRHMLDTLPERADVVFNLDNNHRIVNAHYQQHHEGDP